METLVEFGVLGDLVPWKAPSFAGKHAYKDPRLKKWQKTIAFAAHEAYGKEPFDGPVSLEIWFVRAEKRKSWWQRWWVTRPDLDNLQKALADAIDGQAMRTSRRDPPSPVGRIIKDDNQVVKTMVYKQHGPISGLYVVVSKLDTMGVELPEFFNN